MNEQHNEEQHRALSTIGHCVVLAGPGSGKTRVLTHKLSHLLSTPKLPPRRVALLSYNNESIAEIERRLERMQTKSESAFIGTVHSFCLRHILQPYQALAKQGLPEPLKLATNEQRRKARAASLNYTGLKNDEGFDELRRVAIDRNDADGWTKGGAITKAIVHYENQLRADGLIDFDDAVRTSALMLEQHEFVRRCVSAQFPFLLIDEYQDLGVSLHRIAKALVLKAGCRLFAVGDPNQSIYKFAGARPQLINEWSQTEGVSIVTLNRNYRSARRIILASRALIADKGATDTISTNEGEVKIAEIRGNFEQQCAYLAKTLIPLEVARGTHPGDIAILYPSRNEGGQLVSALEQVGLPYIQLDHGAGFSRTPLVEFARQAMSWCAGGWTTSPGGLRRLTEQWARLMSSSTLEQHQIRALLCSHLFESRDPQQRVADWVESLKSRVLEPTCQNIQGITDIESLTDLMKTSEQKKTRLIDFVNPEESTQHLKLMNLHTSKGTEHSVVFVLGCEEDRIPNWRKKEPEDINEQRRLLFVGVTRAKLKLTLLFSTRKTLPDGMVISSKPSRFLADIRTIGDLVEYQIHQG